MIAEWEGGGGLVATEALGSVWFKSENVQASSMNHLGSAHKCKQFNNINFNLSHDEVGHKSVKIDPK